MYQQQIAPEIFRSYQYLATFKILFLLEFARDSQLVSAFLTTASKDLAAVGGLHALAKTMY